MLPSRVGTVLLVVALAMKLGRVVLTGPVIAPDTQRFVDIARAVKGATWVPIIAPGAAVFYWLYGALLAVFWKVTDSLQQSLELLVGLQAAVSAASVYFLFRTLLWLSEGSLPLAAGLAGLFLLNPDILLWDVRVLSDSLSLSLVVAALSLLAPRLSGRHGARRRGQFTLLMLLSLALVFCRPANLVFLAVSLLALPLEEDSAKLLRRIAAPASLVLLVMAAATIVRYGQTRTRPLAEHWLRLAQAGVVIQDRPFYDVAPIAWDSASPAERAGHLGRTFGKRLLYFWAPALQAYSRRHAFASFTLVGSVWLAGAVAILRIWIKLGPGLLDWYLLSMVVAYNVFHAATLIDFDLRYRIVVVPFVLALIARGFRSEPPRVESQRASRYI